MSTKEYDEAVKLLDSLLPEYKKVSEMGPDEDDTLWYKGARSNGDIGIIPNISRWSHSTDIQGRRTVYRPKFEIRYTLAEARKEVSERRLATRGTGEREGFGF